MAMPGEFGPGFQDVQRADIRQREDVARGARRPEHAAHLRVRHVAADERHVLHARHADVGNEHAVAKQMAGILLAQHARSDPAVGGRRNGHALLFLTIFALNLPCGMRWHKHRTWLLKIRCGAEIGPSRDAEMS